MGTTFNQALKVCDYWYNSNCSTTQLYYSDNAEIKPDLLKAKSEQSSTINTSFEKTDSDATPEPDSSTYGHATLDSVMPFVSKFIPIQAKIVIYPKTETQRLKIVTTASIGEKEKSALKQKPRRKNISKHSRVPRSVENVESSEDDRNLPEFPVKRTLLLFLEALDRAEMNIENDEKLSKLSGYAKKAVKNVKSFFSPYIDEPLENFDPEPGSQMHKLDMEMKEIMEDDVWKNVLVVVASLMETYERETKYSDEREALKLEQLTNLNPRFITKPAFETSQVQHNELPTLNRVKRFATVPDPSKLSHEKSLKIHPETKKLLLKNYVKLFKAKHKHI